jgi:hypothetical protein
MLRNLALPFQQHALRSKAPPIEWHLQLSLLKRIHALHTVSGEGDSFLSAVVTALEDAYTDADLFETICQIRGDKQDGAGTHELVHHMHGEATPDEQVLGCFTRRKQLQPLPIWVLHLASTACRSRTSLAYLVMPHLTPRCWDHRSASLKRMPRT